MEQDEKPELELLRSLEQLKPVPPRDPDVTARGRAQFLTQAQKLRPPVSAEPFWRQIGWNIFPQKEVRVPTIIALVLAFAVALGGSGAVAVAAQDAMPNDPLYPVKLLTEDVRVNLAFDQETRANLLLDFANRRANELAVAGDSTAMAEQTMAREREQVQAALQIAAQLDEAGMLRVLTRSQAQLEQQTRTMEQVQFSMSSQVREMIRSQQALIQLGLQNRNEFRNRVFNAQDKLPPPTHFPPATLPITATVHMRPTEFPLPTGLPTRVITRPTDLPHPTITRTLTIPARPTELPRATFAPTLTVPARPTELPRSTSAPTQIIPPKPTDGNEPPRGQIPPASPPNGGSSVTPPRRP